MTTSESSRPPGGEQQLFAQMSFPEVYEQALVRPLFQPWAELLLDELALRPFDRVLDVACGTGIVARLAADRLGSASNVVGVDVSPPMLAVARRVAPSIDWREGSAEALPLAAGERFDVAVCQQGFQFFHDRAAAAREMHRALVPGGRLAVSTWRSDEDFPLLRELRAVAERHLGPIDDRRYSIGVPGPIEAALREAGFRDIRSTRAARAIRFADGMVFARLNAMALVSMSAASGTLSDDERRRLAEDVAGESIGLVRRHTTESGFACEIGNNVIVATA